MARQSLTLLTLLLAGYGCDSPSTHSSATCGGPDEACCAEQTCDEGYTCDADLCVVATPTCVPSGVEACDGVDSDCDGIGDTNDPDATEACQLEMPGTSCGGNTCSDMDSCEEGSCVCPEGFTVCGAECVVVSNSPLHCGECGNACGDNEDCIDSACITRQSCAADDVSCRGENCCVAPAVPGGTFLMGRSASGTDAYVDGRDIEQPEHEVTIFGFALDKFEVTASRFARFVLAYDSWRAAGNPVEGAGASPNLAGSGWLSSAEVAHLAVDSESLQALIEDCTTSSGVGADAASIDAPSPRNCIDWREARAFCAWDGGWLPTEAEWEFAAAGGDENRLYPWGDAAPDVYGNAIFGLCEACLQYGGIAGSGNGRYGQTDLAGNLSEWTVGGTAVPYSTAACTENCGSVPAYGEQIVLRGGDFYSTDAFEGPMLLRSASRDPVADERNIYRGFRCARLEAK